MKRFLISLAVGLSALVSCSEKIDDQPPVSDGVVPSPNATIYGVVKCGDQPLKGVAVSDGVNVVLTNSNGVYNLNSKKKNALVFISVPSGYEVPTSISGAAQFYKGLKNRASEPERVDFALIKQNQDSYKMIVMGDIHLYTNSTARLFRESFIPEINKYATESPVPVYGMTLGDMSWDWYWYHDDNFGIEQYLDAMKGLKGLPVYNTVGNHDHDMKFNSKEEFLSTGEDWTCMKKYRSLQGPTCFSYNIGGVHYVSLDNVITIDTGGTTDKDSRGYWRGITETDMNWLKKDLSFVDRETPIVVSMHIPLFNWKSQVNAGNDESVNSTIEEITAPFSPFEKVIFITAHTHQCYNTVDYDIDDFSVTEWNNGAVCGNFWGSTLNGLNLCTEGTPGGYRILSVDNGKITSSVYKGTTKKNGYVFRTYDRNKMNLSKESIAGYTTGGVAGEDNNNWVYIRIWDYKPTWKIVVKEGKKELQCMKFESYDPLYLLMLTTTNTKTAPSRTANMFKVQASSATSELTISITDDYGNVYTEIMKRPKDFTLDTYIAEYTE